MMLLLSFLFFAVLVNADYDYNSGSIALWHAENAYCDLGNPVKDYSKGPLAGFVPTLYINETKHDTRGYIGYNSDQKAIYISYRGSESIENWLSDLDAVKTDYPLCSGCEVHKGFYTAEQSVISQVKGEVQRLLSQYAGYSVFVTGHSLGKLTGYSLI